MLGLKKSRCSISVLAFSLLVPSCVRAGPYFSREFKYDAPDRTPIVFGGWSRSVGSEAGEYCLYADVWYADGSNRWGLKAFFDPGTHDWQYRACAFVPEKPVARVKFFAFHRNPRLSGGKSAPVRGTAEFRDLFFERRAATNELLLSSEMTLRPYRDETETSEFRFVDNKSSHGYGRRAPIETRRPETAPTCPFDDYRVWTADSMRRVTPLTFPDGDERCAIDLELARNECESAQILVSVGNGEAWEKGELEIGPLTQDAQAGSPLTVEWRRVGYLPRELPFNRHACGAPAREKWIPDPLLPPAPFRVRKGGTQGLWLTVRADEAAAPGIYTGVVKVLEAGSVRAKVPLTVRVHPFALPRTFGLKTAFSLMDGFLKGRYGERFAEMKRKAIDVMLDYRLNPDDISRTDPPAIEDLLHARERGMNSFNILNVVPKAKNPKQKAVLAVKDPKEVCTDAFYEEFRNRLIPYVAELRRHGLEKLAYVYGFDERKSEFYEGIDRFWKRFRADFPDIPLMTTAKMYADLVEGHTNLPALVTTDIYCPTTYRWDVSVNRRLRAEGKSVWWYTCCSPVAPYANPASIEYPPMDGRLLLGFMTHWADADGFLFWHVNDWSERTQKTLDLADTFFPEWHTRNRLLMPGDGIFLYPAPDEVLPSIRLANVRDGVEDYEWLQLAVSRAGRSAVDALTRRLVRSLTDFTRDPAELRHVRTEVAKLIQGDAEGGPF